LDLPPFKAMPTVRRKDPITKRMRRLVPEGCLPMGLVARWPHSLRDPSYFKGRAVPFTMPETTAPAATWKTLGERALS